MREVGLMYIEYEIVETYATDRRVGEDALCARTISDGR